MAGEREEYAKQVAEEERKNRVSREFESMCVLRACVWVRAWVCGCVLHVPLRISVDLLQDGAGLGVFQRGADEGLRGSHQSLAAARLRHDVHGGREGKERGRTVQGGNVVEKGGGAQQGLRAMKAVVVSMLIEFRGAERERIVVVENYVHPATDALGDHDAAVKGGGAGVRPLRSLDVDLSADGVVVHRARRLGVCSKTRYYKRIVCYSKQPARHTKVCSARWEERTNGSKWLGTISSWPSAMVGGTNAVHCRRGSHQA
jgi:hypothetical protein